MRRVVPPILPRPPHRKRPNPETYQHNRKNDAHKVRPPAVAEAEGRYPAPHRPDDMPLPSAGFARAILPLGGGREEHAVRHATTVGRGTKSPSEFLNAEFLARHRTVAELTRRGLEDDQPFLHDVAAVAHAEGHARVLLDEQDSDAHALELADHVADVPDEGRRQAL